MIAISAFTYFRWHASRSFIASAETPCLPKVKIFYCEPFRAKPDPNRITSFRPDLTTVFGRQYQVSRVIERVHERQKKTSKVNFNYIVCSGFGKGGPMKPLQYRDSEHRRPCVRPHRTHPLRSRFQVGTT